MNSNLNLRLCPNRVHEPNMLKVGRCKKHACVQHGLVLAAFEVGRSYKRGCVMVHQHCKHLQHLL